MLTRACTVICCCLLVVAALLGQSDRGVLTGTILDPVAAVIPAAKVVLTSADTGSAYETVSTPTGNYTLPSLPAGVYDLSVEAAGFKKTTQRSIRIQVAQTLRLDVTLEIGSATDSVTVTAEVALLKTENAEQSVNLSGDRINALPLNFGGGGGSIGQIRSPYNFVVLSPGISGGTGVSGFLGKTRINGTSGSSFRILVEGQDGTSDNDTAWSSIVTQPSVDMVEEFSLQTSNFAAEFGSIGGGVFNFTTRSGTNKLHGSAFEYLNNEALDAHRAFTGARPKSKKHDFGFTVGGPIYVPKLYDGRNKTFFFFNMEMFRNRVTTAGTFNTVPTDAFRKGDFSAVGPGRNLGTDGIGRAILENTIYDPRTSRTIGGQVYTDPFPKNIIPQSLFDPVAVKIQALIPSATNQNIVNNWETRAQDYLDQSIPAFKLDQNFAAGRKVSFYFSRQQTHKRAGVDGLPDPLTAVREQEIFSNTYRLNYDHPVTPTTLVHLGGGYRRFINPDMARPGVLNYDAPAKIGFNGAYKTPSGFPQISGLSSAFGGMMNMGYGGAKYWDDKLTTVASVSHIRNNHSYKLGASYNIGMFSNLGVGSSMGSLGFNAAQTGLPATQGMNLGGGNIGFPYASFLLGMTNSASVSNPTFPQRRKPAVGLYIQDTWKISRRLTFDYGLRWDYSGIGSEIHNRSSELGWQTPNPAAGGLPGANIYEGYGPGRCNCMFSNTYPYAIGPRLGIAYQIDSKTVLRAGWGVTYSAGANYYYSLGSMLGIGQNSVSWSSSAFGAPATFLKDGLTYDHSLLGVETLDPGIRPSPGQLNAPGSPQDPNAGRPGRIMQWNISLQREIIKNLMVEAAYVGNRGAWLASDPWNSGSSLVNLNASSAARLQAFGLDITNPADQAVLTARIDSPLAASRGFRAPYAGYPAGTTVAQVLRPYPQFSGNFNPRWAPLGDNWYDSLQVKVTKRYSSGLDFSSAFTWSKELARGTGGDVTNDVFNRQNWKTLTNTSQPFVFTVAFNYQVPKRGPNRLLRAAVGGWRVGGLLRYVSGFPIPSPTATTNLSSLIFQSTAMNRVPGEPLFLKDPNCHCINPDYDLVLNPKAWQNPGPGQWGTAAGYYNDYRFARRPDEELSFGREIPIREKMSFSIRVEFFNVFNRLYLGDPSASNPLQTATKNNSGQYTAGYGFINKTALANPPRNTQIVARFVW